jgi:hypothetical protein
MKRAAIYLRVSSLDQHPETQGLEIREFARQRGYAIFEEYVDHGVSGARVRRPALDRLLKDAHRRRFAAVLVWSCDRLARSTKHFLEVLDELAGLGIIPLPARGHRYRRASGPGHHRDHQRHRGTGTLPYRGARTGGDAESKT